MFTPVLPASAHRRRFTRRSTNILMIVLTSALALVGPGCTTTRHLEPQAAAAGNALANVPVTVRMNDGRSIKIKVVESSAEYLAGADSSGKLHEIRLHDIQSLQVTRFSAGKTALLTVGIAAAITALATLAYTASAFPAVTL